MKIAYADPPYIGCAHLYRDHPDYAGEVDHPARDVDAQEAGRRLDRELSGDVTLPAAEVEDS